MNANTAKAVTIAGIWIGVGLAGIGGNDYVGFVAIMAAIATFMVV